MSRTRAHRPWRMVRDEAFETRDWRRPEWRWHVSAAYRSTELPAARRRFWKAIRAREREALAAGRELAPTRPRHSVLWELS